MKRLTDNESYCSVADCYYEDGYENCKMAKNCYDKQLYDKLKEYEDLEEQGLLLKLPCKVGDTVYSVENGEIKEFVVSSLDVCMKNIYAYQSHIFIGEIGFSVFVTKEEAEKLLTEMGVQECV